MDSKSNKALRFIAYYLPQYHPIPENDAWWGIGFTEWTNTGKMVPLFPGHYQPHVPADLGYYDLRVQETRVAQAEMAKAYGIEGFCYYHYWFAGKRLLERPFNEVLNTGAPNYPFCLCWANETWTGRWHGCDDKILIEQTYPGKEDYKNHFYELLPAFRDSRYIHVDGKPIFLVYNPLQLPDPVAFTEYWRECAVKEGLKGIYFIGTIELPWIFKKYGFDAVTSKKKTHAAALGELRGTRKARRLFRRMIGYPEDIYNYGKIIKYLLDREAINENVFPSVIPNWDNSPRCGKRGVIFHDAKPKYFASHLKDTIDLIVQKPFDKRLIFIKSWNEWAEGNHLEPDLRYGHAYLEAIKGALENNIRNNIR
jgi:lipopolysaccharide biosynthesis protein